MSRNKITVNFNVPTAVSGKVCTFIKSLVGQKRGGKRLLCLTVVTLLACVLYNHHSICSNVLYMLHDGFIIVID